MIKNIGTGRQTRTLSDHQWQNDPDDDEARKSVRDEPYPGALIPLRGKGLSQRPVEDAGGHTPRLVHVVEAKDGPVDDPVDLSETPCAFAAARGLAAEAERRRRAATRR